MTFCKKKYKKISIFIWMSANIIALIYSGYVYFRFGGGELYAIPILALFTVNFPISMLVGYMFSLTSQALGYWGIEDVNELFTAVLWWIVFVAAGYFQWFVLIPTLWRKVRRLRTGPPLN